MEYERRRVARHREALELILRESVGEFALISGHNVPHYPTVPVDVWLEVPIRPDMVYEQSKKVRELLQEQRLIAELFSRPERAKNMAPATFIKTMNGSWFYGFALMAFGQFAGWWTLEKPQEFSDLTQYADIDQWVKRVGYLHMSESS